MSFEKNFIKRPSRTRARVCVYRRAHTRRRFGRGTDGKIVDIIILCNSIVKNRSGATTTIFYLFIRSRNTRRRPCRIILCNVRENMCIALRKYHTAGTVRQYDSIRL